MGSISEKRVLDLAAPIEVAADPTRPRFRSDRAAGLNESVIREMSRLALQHNAVNLAQGFPDFAAPENLKRAACDAINADVNQYSITWGAKPFRDAIAEKYRRHYQLDFDPEREITVVCGATEGMIAALTAVTNPGDELVVFEPFYENYGPDSVLCGCTRKLVALRPPDWSFDRDELRRAFSHRTKAIILNSPNNPTGRVFNRAELEFIAQLCLEFDALAVTDEIYEHILYDDAAHIPMMQIPGMRDRTILINSLSKTYSVTGWRVGWVLASPDLTDSVRKVHDFLTVGAALAAGGLLHRSRRQIPRAPRPADEYAQRRRLPLLSSAGRVLHHGRYFQFWFRRRHGLGAPLGGAYRRRGRARFLFLFEPC
jgi:aminotransferase